MKKLIGILLATIVAVTIAMPAWACTPRLNLKMPDLQSAYDSAYEAGKNAAKDIKISGSSSKTEIETEIHETETEASDTEAKETETLETEATNATSTAPVFGCTPRYDYSNIWGDLTPPSEIEYKPSEDIDKACENAAKKWLEEHPIDLSKETETDVQETESEIETETETVVETTVPETESYRRYDFNGWRKYLNRFSGYFTRYLR